MKIISTSHYEIEMGSLSESTLNDFLLNNVIALGLPLSPLLHDFFKLPAQKVIRILPGHYIEKNNNNLLNHKY